ncbi:class I adenylate-forming enzyme family protein [Sedimentitalea nanhaiensis]|uniref:Acyl-CoA synthetase (AMP-forming)/AMP-acid ligase II n=1 Tax=Sedimentitalea nanhaiensis TaxID=999627 RepID=A0A1I6X789_9RHOB|nr:class I adenylate-forming enzyme family protein [Sedimentitalea nanhaiensis]SFT33996.1 Acyl-CoA synthetase (AMP-forming)/AMP-acid ligase II [Sedimentitalea nanhaiensis]
MTARWHDYLDTQVAQRSGAPALSDSLGTHWSYGDLNAACDAVKNALTVAGVQPGDRVMVLSENCAAAVSALFAISRLGACAVPVNARQTDREIQRILDHARPAAVLFTSAVSPDAAAHAARMRARAINGPFGTLHLATPHPSSPDTDRDLAVLLYTTGTTGDPKGVMLTHANMLFGGQASATVRGLTSDDVIYGVLPITHVFGLASIVTAVIFAGGFIRFEPRFSAARLYHALSQGITLLSAVPQMHAHLMQYAKEQGHTRLASNSLRVVTSGAAPLDPAWKRKAEAFYGVALQNGYGMTETTAGVCVTRNAIGDPDVSTGPAMPGCEIAIDETVPGGGDGAGEVLVRGPNVMRGYYRNPQATAAVLDGDGWMHTGDLGRIDARGHLHILGRSKELIIHGGFNVYPPEVEAALNEHPQVIQCAVVGRTHDGDEQVLAFVQAAPDDMPDIDDLRAFAARRLAGYKRPSRIVLATDLPAAPTGKILKHKLVQTFAAELADPPAH